MSGGWWLCARSSLVLPLLLLQSPVEQQRHCVDWQCPSCLGNSGDADLNLGHPIRCVFFPQLYLHGQSV